MDTPLPYKVCVLWNKERKRLSLNTTVPDQRDVITSHFTIQIVISMLTDGLELISEK